MKKLRALIRAQGIGDAFIHIVSRALRTLTRGRCELRKHYFFSQPILTKPLLPPHRGANIRVRSVSAHDPAVAQFPRPPKQVAERFSSGAECLVAEIGDNVVGFLWFQSGRFHDDEVGTSFLPSPPEIAVWDFDVYVAPAHRGGLVFARLWDTMNAHVASRGVRFSVSRVLADNEDSLRSHARLGAFPVGSGVSLAIGKGIRMISDLRRTPPDSVAPNTPPALLVPAETSARRSYARFGSAPPRR